MSKEDRKCKSISFDLTDAFEVELLAFAESVEHGKFSRFMKRLIADAKRGIATNPHQQAPVTMVMPQESFDDEESRDMDAFL